MLPIVAATDQEMAKLVLTKHAGSLVKHLLALQGEITDKRIHETRVQSRRLRAAIDTFQDVLVPCRIRRIRKDVRYITRVIGKSRETAVTCELLKGLCADFPSADSAVCEYVIRGMEKKLKTVERRMKKKLRSVNPLSLNSQIDSLLSAMAIDDEQPSKSDGRRKPSQLPLFRSDGSIRERARDAFLPFSRPIRGFTTSRVMMATDDELHRLRIAAKKMRYTMELFDPYWLGGLGDAIALARALQDAGGEYHDWCVLCDCLAGETSECRHNKMLDEYLDHLLTSAEERKKKLRMQILPALKGLQQFLPSLWLERETLPAPASKVLRAPAMIVARGRNKERSLAPEGRRRSLGSLP